MFARRKMASRLVARPSVPDLILITNLIIIHTNENILVLDGNLALGKYLVITSTGAGSVRMFARWLANMEPS